MIYAILGLGYVGLSLAVALGKKEHQVYGYDIKSSRIEQLKQHNDKNHEIKPDMLKQSKVQFTDQLADIAVANFYIIAVPTPSWYYEAPNLSPIISVVEQLATILKKGDIVVFESTVYPGTTEDICIPIFERVSQLKSKKDFHVGYSPERINPGDECHNFDTVPKIVSGQTPYALAEIKKTYASICHSVYPVSSIKVAEAIKVLENTQRDVNIAFMNEFTKIMHALDIDTHEIIEGAKTKWNFLPFKPGFVGGHCISVDPHYLAFDAKRLGVYPELILSARHINDSITQFVIQSMLKLLVKQKIALQNITVAIFGVTYKENVNDIRNSLVFKLIKELKTYDIKCLVHDPMDHSNNHFPMNIQQVSSLKDMQDASVAILLVGHGEYKKWGLKQMLKICNNAALFMDIPNLFVDEAKQLTNISYWNL